MLSSIHDVAVIGAGPSGVAVARACAARGLDTICIAPQPRGRWMPSYGAWAPQIANDVAAEAVEKHWPRARVTLDRRRTMTLDRPYVRLHTGRLQQVLLEAASEAGVRWRQDTATAITHDEGTSMVQGAGGEAYRARVVIDASGHRSRLVRRVDDRPAAYQTAYGRLLRVRRHPWALDEMTLMDFSGPERAPGEAPNTRDVPSFLYAMPLGEDRVFVEETCLVRRPMLPREPLARRLERRLAAYGVEVVADEGFEWCVIPMGTAPPAPHQRTVAFGGAASMVHPASGYMLTRALSRAPAVAEALAKGLDSGTAADASRAAHRAVWSPGERRAHELYTFGMHVLARLDAEQTRAFFETFFQLPPATWQGFLDATLTPTALCAAMWRVFSMASTSTRARILTLGATRGSSSLWRAITPLMPS